MAVTVVHSICEEHHGRNSAGECAICQLQTSHIRMVKQLQAVIFRLELIRVSEREQQQATLRKQQVTVRELRTLIRHRRRAR